MGETQKPPLLKHIPCSQHWAISHVKLILTLLLMPKCKLREVKYLTQSLTANKYESSVFPTYILHFYCGTGLLPEHVTSV